MKLLSGKTALITGASRGIGRGIALEMAKQGANIAFTYLSSPDKAATLEAELAEMGIKAKGYQSDASDFKAAEDLINAVVAEFTTLDIVVNNAGITQDQLAMRMKDDEWDAVIATNLTAVARLSRAVLRGMMKAKYGRIINITSVVGSAGNPGQMNYAAAKAGVAGMSRALAREIGSRNITVNCIAPGFIDTDMTKALTEQQVAALLQQIPAGRFGTPEDIAASVSFLASPQAGYITGTTLHVNGGMYMSGG